MAEYAWLITAIISSTIFFALVDWSRIKYTVWGGVIAFAVQQAVDMEALKLNLYSVDYLFSLWGSSVFFSFGIVIPVGILFAQTLPFSRWLQGINILVISVLFNLEEVLYLKVGALQHIHWNLPASMGVDLLVFTAFTWIIDSLGLNRRGRRMSGGFKL